MSVRNGIALLLALSTLTFLIACGGSSAPKVVAPPSGAFSNSKLNGTYVFSVSGTDLSGFPLAVAGTFNANGAGSITGGAVDMNDGGFSSPAPNLSIGGGSTYNVGPDGRGSAALAVSGSPFGSKLLLDFVLSSSSHGLVIEFDGNSGSGTMDLQAAGATPTGSYAFLLSGATIGSSPTNWATAGNFTLTGATLAGTDDFNESGLIPFPGQSLTGNFALGPSATPSTTLVTAGFGTLTFDVFAIDATHLKFIEMDPTATLSGDAFSQSSTAMPTGTLAFTMSGALTSSQVPFAAGGFMTTSGTNITGSEDFTDGTTVSSQSSPAPFTATVTAGGTGRFTLGSFVTFVGGTSYAAYPSTGGLLLLEIDSSGITMGAAYTQTSPLPALASSQGYGLNLSGINLAAATEVDDIAEFTAGTSGTLTTGIIDENSPGGNNTVFDLGLTNGAYGTIDNLGRYGLSANASNSNNSTLNGGFNLTLYTVDGTTFPFIELDGGQIATGVVVLQNPAASAAAAASQSHMFVVQPLIRAHAARQKKN